MTTTFTTLNGLFTAMRANDQTLGDWTDLPVFGGEEPAETTGIWSWDAHSLIVGTHAGDLRLIDRDEYAQEREDAHARREAR